MAWGLPCTALGVLLGLELEVDVGVWDGLAVGLPLLVLVGVAARQPLQQDKIPPPIGRRCVIHCIGALKPVLALLCPLTS